MIAFVSFTSYPFYMLQKLFVCEDNDFFFLFSLRPHKIDYLIFKYCKEEIDVLYPIQGKIY